MTKKKTVNINEIGGNFPKTLSELEKKFGKGVLIRMSDKEVDYEGFSTGSLSLDKALGGHGWPVGRIIELFGPESAGKTSVALTAIKEVQKSGQHAAYIDAEHALNMEWAERLGVNLDTLYLNQPAYGEQALQVCEALIKGGDHRLIVVDSVASLTPKAELDGEIGDVHVGLQARMMGQAMRKLTGEMNNKKTTVIFINQLRSLVGVMKYAPKETTPGGRALKFYSSVRIRVSRKATLKDKDGEAYGITIIAKVEKNKMARPFQECCFDLIFDTGISKDAEIYDQAIQCGLIKKRGSNFGGLSWSNRDSAIELLKSNPEIANTLYAEVQKSPIIQKKEEQDDE